MFRNLGPLELLLILGIIVLLFGVGRLSKIGGELGRGIRNFRQALSGGEAEGEAETEAGEETPTAGEQA